MPEIVTDVSAILVDITYLRTPGGAGAKAFNWRKEKKKRKEEERRRREKKERKEEEKRRREMRDKEKKRGEVKKITGEKGNGKKWKKLNDSVHTFFCVKRDKMENHFHVYDRAVTKSRKKNFKILSNISMEYFKRNILIE